jgi:hemolysin activation/secretion protein
VGGQEISTFYSGSLRGDSGWVVRSELSTQVRISFGQIPVLMSPYAFIGFGQVSLANPSAIESRSTNATTYGVGVDLFSQTDSSFKSSSVRIELGRGERNDNMPDDTRLSISGNVRF